jgi:pilus assembly protein CpaB
MRVGTLNRILAAAVCAAGATYLTVSFLSAPRTQVVAPAVPRSVQPEAKGLDTKTVIVAAVSLQFGTPLTAAVLAEVEWPAASVPPGAFTSREALLGPGGQRTVLTSIGKSEPILASRITGPGQRGSLAAVIEDGKKAVTIRVDDVLGVAGFVQPNDRVDVLLTRNERPATPTGRPATGTAYSDLLLQNVRVLAVDQLADRGQAKPAKAVTIEVDTEDAQKVALGASVGQLSLALRQAGSSFTTDVRRIGIDDLGRPNELETPRQPTGDRTLVTVTRGVSERSIYEISEGGRREFKLTVPGRQDPNQGPPAQQDTAQLITQPE